MRKNSEKQRGKLAENLRKRGKMHWNLVVG
jgi:hypothetical protein